MNLQINHCAAMLLMMTAGAVTAEEAPISVGKKNDQGFLIHTVESSLQSRSTTIRLLLPDQMEKDLRYSVLYVLPVEAENGTRYGDGLAECKSRGIHNKHRLICVAPTFADLPWYADHPSDSRIQQETYFTRVVVPFVDKTYPTNAQPESRWLVGFSKSGWGAFSLLLRHRDVFGKAAAWDAPFMKEQPDQFGMGAIFGTQENFERYQISRLLRHQASELRGPIRLFHLGFGNFADHHEAAERLMTELKISHRYKNGPKRDHTWHSGWLPEAAEMIAEESQESRE